MIRNWAFNTLASASICMASRWGGAESAKEYSLIATGVSPIPTQVPFLGKRGGQQPLTVCGFIGGSNALPATCSTSSACAWNTDYSIVGCCHTNTAKGCLFYTGCEDIKSTHTSDDPMVYTCKGTSTCFQNTYDGGFKQWGCGFSPTTVLLTYSGQSPDAPTVVQSFIGTKEMMADALASIVLLSTATSSSVLTINSAKTTSMAYTTFSNSPAPSSATQQTSESTAKDSTSSILRYSTPAPSDTATPVKTGPSTRTIVGSAVGALAFGAITVALIFWFFIRRKKQGNKIAHHVSQEPMSIIGSPGKGNESPAITSSSAQASARSYFEQPYQPGSNSDIVSSAPFSPNPSHYGDYPHQPPSLQYGWHPGSNLSTPKGPTAGYQAYNPLQDMPPRELDASPAGGYQQVSHEGATFVMETSRTELDTNQQ